MPQTSAIFIGVKGTVLALDRATGTVIWRTKLKGSGFVNVVVDQGQLYATTQGEVFRVDPGNGQALWTNPLPGFGVGLVTIATPGSSPTVAMQEKGQRDAAASTPIVY